MGGGGGVRKVYANILIYLYEPNRHICNLSKSKDTFCPSLMQGPKEHLVSEDLQYSKVTLLF
jgi:hypothetical protein